MDIHLPAEMLHYFFSKKSSIMVPIKNTNNEIHHGFLASNVDKSNCDSIAVMFRRKSYSLSSVAEWAKSVSGRCFVSVCRISLTKTWHCMAEGRPTKATTYYV